MKRTPRVPVEVLISLAALLCFITLALLDYERQLQKAEDFDTFSTFDYHPGGYRAWFDLLRSEGVSTRRYERRPGYLDDSVSVFIVANNFNDAIVRAKTGGTPGFFAPGDYTAMLRWVKHGGRLVWLADGEYSGADASLHFPPVDHSALKTDEAIALAPSALTSGVRSVSGTSRLRVFFRNSASALPLIGDDTGASVVWYRLGRGDVIVVTDESLFQNSRISKADNARLAYDVVVAGLSPRGVVAFEEWSHGYQAGDTWWTILPRQMQWAFVIFCAAMLLALLGSAIRFGPAVALPQNSERTSHEYVSSMAQLMQRARAARKAVRDLAQLGHHAAARAFGYPDSVPASELAARLRDSDREDGSAAAIMTLDRLAGYEHPSAQELIRAADLCSSLRKEYESHGDWRRTFGRQAQRRSA
ncbi:MAG: DUF4350 domain-containing protein [Candidatus Eremiobacteraeota bacterium]|nr:DUF4350 domain-containing protein [Candidatus Eremiobacteraeota bacterium]